MGQRWSRGPIYMDNSDREEEETGRPSSVLDQHVDKVFERHVEVEQGRPDTRFEHLYSSEGKEGPSTSGRQDAGQRSEARASKSKCRRNKGQKKKRAHWVLRFNCARLKSGSGSSGGSSEPEVGEATVSCVCAGCRRTGNAVTGEQSQRHGRAATALTAAGSGLVERSDSSDSEPIHHLLDFTDNPHGNFLDFTSLTNRLRYQEEAAVEDCDERARIERAREIAEGMEPPPGYRPKQQIQLLYGPEMICLDSLTVLLHSAALSALSQFDSPNMVHTQVDYIHCLVPDLLQITLCSFYWGKMDRYEAERLLEGKPEGTFLLRDSAQEEYLFSVSFRKYGRSLHARIEQWKHMFSFDSHDPGVYSSPTVCGLIEHYKDPSCCMFFEPTLTYPLHRNFSFPLQHLCRAVICSKVSYDGIAQLRLPKPLKSYLKEYHYKQRVKVRVFDSE